MIRRSILLAVVLCPAWAEEAHFGEGLYQILEKAACRSCHNPDGVASVTRLHFPEPDSAPERIEAFGKALVTLVDRERPDNSLLLNKPTNRIPHAVGERIKAGSEDEAALKAWIRRLVQLSLEEVARALRYREEEAAGAGYVRPRMDLRRLTHSQVNNTVCDLLGDPARIYAITASCERREDSSLFESIPPSQMNRWCYSITMYTEAQSIAASSGSGRPRQFLTLSTRLLTPTVLTFRF